MTTVNISSQPKGSEPSSWKSAISKVIANGASKNYSILKNQVTYPLSPADSTQVSPADQNQSPSFLGSIKRGISSISRTQCMTAFALVAIGYAYSQAPTFDNTVNQFADYLIEHSSLETQAPQQAPQEPQTNRIHALVTLVLSGVAGLQHMRIRELGSLAATQTEDMTEMSKQIAAALESTVSLNTLLGAQTQRLKDMSKLIGLDRADLVSSHLKGDNSIMSNFATLQSLAITTSKGFEALLGSMSALQKNVLDVMRQEIELRQSIAGMENLMRQRNG